jgi:hypothetical protein
MIGRDICISIFEPTGDLNAPNSFGGAYFLGSRSLGIEGRKTEESLRLFSSGGGTEDGSGDSAVAVLGCAAGAGG